MLSLPSCRTGSIVGATVAIGMAVWAYPIHAADPESEALGQVGTLSDDIGNSTGPCEAAMQRAAEFGLPTADSDAEDSELTFRWRLSEHAVSFQTDEFDQAQLSTLMTSLVTGRGNYPIRLSLPASYEQFSAASNGGVRIEGCAPKPGQSPVECTVVGTGAPGCFQLGFRLPPIASVHADDREDVDQVRMLHFFAGTGAFLSPGGKSMIVFTMPGDYSKPSEEPGGHKLDQLDRDLGVETDFVFDPRTEQTTLVVANGKANGSTNNSVGVTLYGRKMRGVSAQELLAMLTVSGRATLHINFDFGKAMLRPDAMPAIERVTAALKDNPDLNIEIEGHTDSVGTKRHNQALSEARAKAVKAALEREGIASDRLATVGFGASKPIADNDSEDGRFRNRRVELVKN